MRDVAWFGFFNVLHCKAEEAGREVIEVNPKGTSQVCSQCGQIVQKNLSVRVHACQHCKCSLGRDFNSALNILRLGARRQDPTTLQVVSPEKPPGFSLW